MTMLVFDDSDGFIRDLIAATEAGLGAASLEGAEGAAASMPGAGAGGVTGKSGRLQYRASNPGAPPGVRSNNLKGSIANARLRPLVWGYGTSVFYGRIHETGKLGGGVSGFVRRRIKSLRTGRRSPSFPKRPFLKPTLVTERVNMERAFTRTASRHMARSITARVA